MAIRRVARRLARDFWVRPSEKMVRRWCRAFAAGLDFVGDYQPWVVESFSGVLWVLLQRPGQPARGRGPLRWIAARGRRSRSDRAGELRPRRRQAQGTRDPLGQRREAV